MLTVCDIDKLDTPYIKIDLREGESGNITMFRSGTIEHRQWDGDDLRLDLLDIIDDFRQGIDSLSRFIVIIAVEEDDDNEVNVSDDPDFYTVGEMSLVLSGIEVYWYGGDSYPLVDCPSEVMIVEPSPWCYQDYQNWTEPGFLEPYLRPVLVEDGEDDISFDFSGRRSTVTVGEKSISFTIDSEGDRIVGFRWEDGETEGYDFATDPDHEGASMDEIMRRRIAELFYGRM